MPTGKRGRPRHRPGKLHADKGQPVLVGTVSIEKSEMLSEFLNQEGVKHAVLNARFHESEAHIVAQAGRKGAVTVSLAAADPGTLVTDIVYTPLRTGFLLEAEARGCTVVDGLGMLLHQAVPGFERWFGRRPEVDEETREAVLAS